MWWNRLSLFSGGGEIGSFGYLFGRPNVVVVIVVAVVHGDGNISNPASPRILGPVL